MSDMFKSWSFWRPIFLLVTGTIEYFVLIIYFTALIPWVFAATGIIGFCFMLYQLGKSTYDLEKSKKE